LLRHALDQPLQARALIIRDAAECAFQLPPIASGALQRAFEARPRPRERRHTQDRDQKQLQQSPHAPNVPDAAPFPQTFKSATEFSDEACFVLPSPQPASSRDRSRMVVSVVVYGIVSILLWVVHLI